MNFKDIVPSKISQSQRTSTVCHPYGVSNVVIEIEGRKWQLSSPRGRKEKELVFNGYRVQNEKVLVICCKTKQIHLTPLNFTLKNSEDVKFIFFNHNKKKISDQIEKFTCKMQPGFQRLSTKKECEINDFYIVLFIHSTQKQLGHLLVFRRAFL